MFKLALLQMHIEGGNKKRNLRRAEVLISEAVKNGADVVLLPEAMNLGWTHPSAKFKQGQSCFCIFSWRGERGRRAVTYSSTQGIQAHR